MFFALLIVTFLIATAVSFGVVRLFDRPVSSILQRIVAEELSGAWHRYIKFAAYVVGISGGVQDPRFGAIYLGTQDGRGSSRAHAGALDAGSLSDCHRNIAGHRLVAARGLRRGARGLRTRAGLRIESGPSI